MYSVDREIFIVQAGLCSDPMPKYMYADSTEFPLHRDFINLLERLSDAAIEAIPTQKQITDLKKRISKNESQEKAQLSEIDRFGKELNSSIDNVTSKFGDGNFTDVSGGIKDASAKHVKAFRESEQKRFEEQLKARRTDLSKRQASLLQILGEYVYYDPLSVAKIESSVSLRGRVYDGEIKIVCESGISYAFSVDFFEKRMRVGDLIEKTVQVPAVMKTTIIAKEKKPHFVSIGDWTLSKAEYESNGETVLEATIQKNTGDENSPCLEMVVKPGETRLESLAYVDDEGRRTDILKDPDLNKHLNRNLEEYSKYLLGHFFGLLNKKNKVLAIGIDGVDLINEDLTEEFILRCAKEYGPTINSIREKGLVDNELNLKAEDLEGKRTEVYLKIDEFKAKMDTIPQGRKICTILGL